MEQTHGQGTPEVTDFAIRHHAYMARNAPGSQTATGLLASEQLEGWSQCRTAPTKNHQDALSLILGRDETSRGDSKGYIPTQLSWIECCRCRNPVCGWGWSNVRRPINTDVIDPKARTSCWVFNHYFSLKYVLDP